MAYLTENQLSNTLDIPVSLPATDLVMGNWVVISTVSVVAPMRLSYRYACLQLLAASVNSANITSGNKAYGSLGLVYLALRKDYSSGSPGAAGGLDVLVASNIGLYTRDTTNPVTIIDPGTYSWIIANNMQPSTDASPIISPSTSIDFRVAVTGTVRMELNRL